ncbi:hypothetical protein ACX818_001457 [Acinetobacter baumannii]
MSNNQILAMVLMAVYGAFWKAMPPMDFSNPNYVVPFIITSLLLTFVSCKLVK